MDLERREISAYQGVLAYTGHAGVDGLPHACAAAIDLQRSVLQWLEGEATPSSTPDDAVAAQREPHTGAPATRTRGDVHAWLDRVGVQYLREPAPAAGGE